LPLPRVSSDPRYLTIWQIAQRCQVAYGTAYDWIVREQRIREAEQLGNRSWRVPVAAFERWLAEETNVRIVPTRTASARGAA
jgi:transposase